MRFQSTKIIVVLGSMRSGSTVLRQLIASADRAVDLGEVFNDDITKSTSFWKFLKNASAKQDRFLHPHYWDEVWTEFVKKQSRYFDASIFCVDAKISCIDVIYRPFARKSRFFFDGPDVHYILLHRNDLLAQAISLHNAYRTNCWAIIDDDPSRGVASRFHMTSGEQPAPKLALGPNMVDPEYILNTMRYIKEQYSLLQHAMTDMNFEEIVYETMFDEKGLFTDSTLEVVARMSNMPPSAFDRLPALKKQGDVDILRDVVNAQELVKALQSSEFDYTVDRFLPLA